MKPSKPEVELTEKLVAGGTNKSTAETVARDLQRLAAIHLKMMLQSLNVGLDTAEESALTKLETEIESKAQALPGVSGIDTRGDPRAVTLGLKLDSKESNSFTGEGWWITVDERDMKSIGDDLWGDYLPEQEELIDNGPAM